MALPYQAIPTTSFIDYNSTNHNVRQFLAELLQAIDSHVTASKALELADKFEGTGYDALQMTKEGWVRLLGESYGGLVFIRFSYFRITYVDKDTIWPHLRHIFWIFVFLLLINTGGAIFDKKAITINRGWNIAAFIYFICYGFAYNFAVAKTIDDNPAWPEYFKLRPTGPNQKNWLSSLGHGT